MESVRSMLHQANLPKKFWAEAVATAVYLKNRSPSSCFSDETPYERWFKQKPDVSNLRIFGCIAFAHIPPEKRKKLDEKSLKCIFIGYLEQSKGFKLFNPKDSSMIGSRDVIFKENIFHYIDNSNVDDPDELLPEIWFNIGSESPEVEPKTFKEAMPGQFKD